MKLLLINDVLNEDDYNNIYNNIEEDTITCVEIGKYNSKVYIEIIIQIVVFILFFLMMIIMNQFYQFLN